MNAASSFNTALSTIEGYPLAYLTPEHGPLVQELCERCADAIELVMGVPPGPAEAQSLYIDLPEGKGYEDKLLLGVFAGPDELIGMLDAVRDYPAPGEWRLGVLMFDPAHRGQGLGTRIVRAFERWAAAAGARAIQLTVAQQCEAAYRFWQRLGYQEREWQPPQRFGARASVFIVMRRALGPQGEP